MPSPDSSPRAPIKGVFSTMEVKKTGSGATTQRTKVKQYWLVNEIEGGKAEVQPINENLIPIGKKRVVSLDDVLERFQPEPDFFVHKSFAPQPPEGEIATDEGAAPGAPPRQPETIEGFEISGSPEEMERSARASFGIGLTYLKRGNLQRAEDVFERLADMQADFQPEHKHMFNDFGVSLRRQNLFDTALKHYMRALELAHDDENLLHNIARAHYEKRDIKSAIKYLEMSLAINPDHEMSRKFLAWIKRKHRDAAGPVVLDF
ncbi:tetratricopeptide (TPR) repeat protein [Desulfobaculum xiamenense]|uniref:Tetratricopeptide (TPR) repeat protein n=1 Tax=Desulfobaculum xiamenense TaxID=995050 RepID=A0A846QNN1_9BACT|nr:tetratricopeptide repeat protein [Desulfobaculum xiamenense]NJB68797.1 tetratricopeptide (TPR) repeat protein [Desulfobaculum xiamenense]